MTKDLRWPLFHRVQPGCSSRTSRWLQNAEAWWVERGRKSRNRKKRGRRRRRERMIREEKQRGQGKGSAFKNTYPVTYFLQLGSTS